MCFFTIVFSFDKFLDYYESIIELLSFKWLLKS